MMSRLLPKVDFTLDNKLKSKSIAFQNESSIIYLVDCELGNYST